MLVIAARTAAIWIRTSLQSRPDGLGVFVHVAVALGVVVAVCVFMVVVRVVDVGLVMQMGDVMLVQIRVIVRMLLCHEGAPYLIS